MLSVFIVKYNNADCHYAESFSFSVLGIIKNCYAECLNAEDYFAEHCLC